MIITLKFVHHATTKGTYRYQELGPGGEVVPQRDAVVGALYVRKAAFGNTPPPENITITLTTEK